MRNFAWVGLVSTRYNSTRSLLMWLGSTSMNVSRHSLVPVHPLTRWCSRIETVPDGLHVPQFTYTTPVAPVELSSSLGVSQQDASQSRAFAFSALFQSSPVSGVSLHPSATPSDGHTPSRSILREQPATTFIGFSWGPSVDAFDAPSPQRSSPLGPTSPTDVNTPRPLHRLGVPATPFATVSGGLQSTPLGNRYPFATPIRPSALTPYGTLPRASTVRRTAPRRAVSDREALKQLVDCVSQSARKKVLESGRKPRFPSRTPSTGGAPSALKELRFDTSVAVVGVEGAVSYRPDAHMSASQSTATSAGADDTFGTSLLSRSASASAFSQELLIPELDVDMSLSDADSSIPPSPSPSPRPGSAMSMLSKRSQTPTTSSFQLPFLRVGASRSQDSSKLSPLSPMFPTAPPPAPITRPEPQRFPKHQSKGPPRREEVTKSECYAPPREEEPARVDATASSSRATTYTASLSYDVLDDLDRRFASLMQDITGVERRLGTISARVRS